MLTIQQGAKEIYSDNPKSLYFFTGPEYGVKVEYIQALVEKYQLPCEEYESLNQVFDSFKQKSLLPRQKKVFVVRYDKDFISKLNTDSVKLINSLNIVGTVIGLYQDDKEESKLDKFFPDATLRINKLTPTITKKHLCQKYPKLDDTQLDAVISVSVDYYQASIMCENLSYLSESQRGGLTKTDIEHLFGFKLESSSERFKHAVASRNFKATVAEIDAYEGDFSMLFYDMLSTYLEIAKVLQKASSTSFARPYAKLWDWASLKYMYDISYEQLEKLRNYSKYDPYNSLIYACSLLQFKLR